MVIWKFSLIEARTQWPLMPRGAKILCVQVQRGEGYLWVECDPKAQRVQREIIIRGTGFETQANALYIGTFQMDGGDLVWHVYDGGENL